MTTPRYYGWRKDPRDERDYLLRAARPAVIPQRSDLSAFIPAVWDQGRQGSCTGHGTGAILTGLAIQLGLIPAAMLDPAARFSPRWLYYLGRLAIDEVYQDNGAYARDILSAAGKVGACLERVWQYPPYPSYFDAATADPPPACARQAAKHLILSYTRVVDGVDGICTALSHGHLVTLGAPWYEKWESPGSDGKLAKVSCLSKIAGGHQTYLYGHDYAARYFNGSNSWGTSWGNGGRFLLPFSAIAQFKKKGGYDAHFISVEWSS